MRAVYKLLLLALIANVWVKLTSGQSYSSALLASSKSAQLRAYMYLKASPCDNFYDWACGRWKKTHPATQQNTHTSRLSQLPELFLLNCAAVLQQRDNASVEVYSHDRVVDNQLKRLFKSCRRAANATVTATARFEPILRVVNFRGGWPAIVNLTWYERDYDWLKAAVQVRRKLNADVLIGFDIVPDFASPNARRVKLGAPALALGTRESYLSDEQRFVGQRRQYVERIAEKLRAFFPEMPSMWADDVAGQVLNVERKLALGLPDNARLSPQELTTERLVKDLKLRYGEFVDISRYLQLMFRRVVNGRVYETPPDYFANLVTVIQDTPKLTLANYTMWQALRQFDLGGDDTFCVRKVMAYFPRQLENLFYRNFTSKHTSRELQTEFQRIKIDFIEQFANRNLRKFDWITPYTLAQLQSRIRSMRIAISTGLSEVNYFKIHAYDLRLSDERYYENVVSVLQWQVRESLNQILDSRASSFFVEHFELPKYEYRYLPAYNAQTNAVEVPVTFLLSRFFWDPAYPAELKFSTLSFFLAQQLIYGLNSDNASDGDAPQMWDAASQAEYAKRVNCFLQQQKYATDEFRGKVVNDPGKLAKIIADNGAIAAAFRMYEKWRREPIRRREPAKGLPDVNYTRREIFFISFAQLWCADYNPHWVFTFDELPEALRVNGALANIDEFAKEFQCSLNSPMNAKRECVVF